MDGGAQQRVVAVGASAGGVGALIQLAAGLPRDLGDAVMVVLHARAGAPPSRLAGILDRSGPLPAVWAAHGDLIETGRIHVAVPNRHLLVGNGRVMLSDGPIEDGHRPAINPLFRAVALAYRERAVGVLMSGFLDDGVHGLAAIRARGGIGIIQTPRDAQFPALPLNALRAGVVDHQVAASEAGGLLRHLADRTAAHATDGAPDKAVTAIASALDYAHKQGLLHRDVKPANIMLTNADDDGGRRILLANFGIARSVDDISGLIATNMTAGTVTYCAPEQLMGEDIDGRADQYALAATAYHLLTGSQLFPHSNPAVVIGRHLNATPPALADTHPELAALDPALAVALAKDPDDRFRRCIDSPARSRSKPGRRGPVPPPRLPNRRPQRASQPARRRHHGCPQK